MKKFHLLSVFIVVMSFHMTAQAAVIETNLCIPISVDVAEGGSANERVVVTCKVGGKDRAGAETIKYYAVSTANSDRAGRYQLLADAAILSGRRIHFTYDHTTLTGGCALANCRTPLDFGME